MTKRIKIRMKTWYWGNYCTFPANREIPQDFEIYIEKDHGWNHSEEYKKGQLTNRWSKELKYEDITKTN